jgi:hypothetical protein
MSVGKMKRAERRHYEALGWSVGSTAMRPLMTADHGYQDPSDWYAETYPKIHGHDDDQGQKLEARAAPTVESS